jgi:hypothetical protein
MASLIVCIFSKLKISNAIKRKGFAFAKPFVRIISAEF